MPSLSNRTVVVKLAGEYRPASTLLTVPPDATVSIWLTPLESNVPPVTASPVGGVNCTV